MKLSYSTLFHFVSLKLFHIFRLGLDPVLLLRSVMVSISGHQPLDLELIPDKGKFLSVLEMCGTC